MKQTEIQTQLKDLREIANRSNAPARSYNKTKSNDYKPEFARFKAKYWFTDGNCATFYSFDLQHSKELKKKVRDEWKGLFKLVRWAKKCESEGKLKTCVIWANVEDIPNTAGNYDLEVYKRVVDKNKTKSCPHLHFDQTGKAKLPALRRYLDKLQRASKAAADQILNK